MNNYRDNRSGNNRSSYRGNSDSRDGRPPLHDAVCIECGKDCKVPFRPSGSKPVYCSECFETKGGGGDNRSNQRGSFRPSFGGRDSGRPSFGGRDSGRPPRQGNSSGPDFSKLTKNIEVLNNKLDRIISLLAKNEVKPAKKKSGGVADMVASLKKSEADLASSKSKKTNKSKIEVKVKAKSKKPKKASKPAIKSKAKPKTKKAKKAASKAK